jgi:hypothetical protein
MVKEEEKTTAPLLVMVMAVVLLTVLAKEERAAPWCPSVQVVRLSKVKGKVEARAKASLRRALLLPIRVILRKLRRLLRLPIPSSSD